MVALLALGLVGAVRQEDAARDGAAQEPTAPARVEAFRVGAAEGSGTALLVRLVARDDGDGGRTLHAAFDLPGVRSRVHLVERLAADGSRTLVHREATGDHVRSVRVERDGVGGSQVVVHGEGLTQRRWAALPDGAMGPLERIEDERVGGAASGARLALEPGTGRVRRIGSQLHARPLGPRAGCWMRLWVDRDGRGAVQAARLYVGRALVAWRPSAGRQLAPSVPGALHAALAETAGDAPKQ